ncbi:MAG: class I SAM-dependent methyltransferase [Planctomycetes bacterium]|nr:class I SAM-dependent methyltransferase [Planctomycetota bacterium]
MRVSLGYVASWREIAFALLDVPQGGVIAQMDVKDRFSSAADDYAKYRPDYPADVVHACADYAALPAGAAIVDIGCGTGISSRLFARHGYAVTGVEPNAPMRAKAIEAGSGPAYKEGEAAKTGLADGCADMITCAQALHWFNLDDCVAEWQRILNPQGACAAFWNYRADTGWQAEYESLLLEWSSEYADVQKAVDGGQDNSAWVKASPLCGDVAEREFPNAQRMDFTALLGRANSSSYVIHGVADKPRFERALKTLFDRHQQEGHVSFSYRTYVLLWRFPVR